MQMHGHVAKQLHMVSAGVFDGHGFNGRSAATYARKNITKWLSVDGNAASKPQEALESAGKRLRPNRQRPC